MDAHQHRSVLSAAGNDTTVTNNAGHTPVIADYLLRIQIATLHIAAGGQAQASKDHKGKNECISNALALPLPKFRHDSIPHFRNE